MKQIKFYIICVLCVFLWTSLSQSKENAKDWPVLKGPYLGQKPPGNRAEVFMDGIISTLTNPEMNAACNYSAPPRS